MRSTEGPSHDPQSEASETRVRLGDGEWVPVGALLGPMIEDLRRAASCIRKEGQSAPTYQTTAVLHEGVLRVLQGKRREWNDDRHFFNYLKTSIAGALADAQRRRKTAKRGKGAEAVELSAAHSDPRLQVACFEEKAVAIIDAYQYQHDLRTADPEAHSVFMLHFVEELTLPEVADELGITARQAKRRWHDARTYLRVRIQHDEGSGEEPDESPEQAAEPSRVTPDT